jgi:membrane protein DedA with SNARE-associated domain
MWWLYLVVFVASFAVDLIPIIGPPAWTVMLVLAAKYDLNLWGVLLAGVPGSALGRYVLSLYIPKLSDKLLKRQKNEDLQFLGNKLGQTRWKSWTFVFLYTLMPLPSTPLFTAAGVARIHPGEIVPPFFAGKFISDAIMVVLGITAASSLKDVLHGTFSTKGIVTAVVGLLLIAALLFVDWRVLLEDKKLRLHFKIWK